MNRLNFNNKMRNKLAAMPAKVNVRGIAMTNPLSMPTRPPIIFNKARGTMSSSTYSPMSGI